MTINYTGGRFTTEDYAQIARDRHEAEVRYVAGFDTDAHREVYLESIWGTRGEAVAKRLRSDVWDYMRKNGLVVQPKQEALFG